jgi:hypothetical protein
MQSKGARLDGSAYGETESTGRRGTVQTESIGLIDRMAPHSLTFLSGSVDAPVSDHASEDWPRVAARRDRDTP